MCRLDQAPVTRDVRIGQQPLHRPRAQPIVDICHLFGLFGDVNMDGACAVALQALLSNQCKVEFEMRLNGASYEGVGRT